MDKKTFWMIAGIAMVVLVAFFVWQTMQINALASASQIAQSSAAQTSSAASASAGSYGGMVGGC